MKLLLKVFFVLLFICIAFLAAIVYLSQRTSRTSHTVVPSTTGNADANEVVTKVQPDCQKLYDGDGGEISRLEAAKKKWQNSMTDEKLMAETENCSWVHDQFYNNSYVTKLELSFPIAFTFLAHNSPQQVMRLLKLLYRPHNQYCIHLDEKSSITFKKSFMNMARCLDNVMIASKLISVKWGHRSIMESLMQCYKDLERIRQISAEDLKWKYVINLSGKELPLNTNHEIVSHFANLNGTSFVEANKVPSDSWRYNHRLRNKNIPYNSAYYVGSLYMGLSHQFVLYLLTDPVAIHLFEFFGSYCDIPEEHYFSTLYMRSGVPGGFNPNMSSSLNFLVDNYFWMSEPEHQKECKGANVHHICIVEIGDLQKVLNRTNFGKKALFQNKYFMENDHLIMDCMEELIFARNKLEFKNDMTKAKL